MFEKQIAREAPISLKRDEKGTVRPDVSKEPVLAIDKIQGNIVGFNKDYQTFIFLKVTQLEGFRAWLGRLIPFIATASEVLQFNQLFKAIRWRRDVETHTVESTWINVAFSFKLLQAMTADAAALKAQAAKFDDYKDEKWAVDDFKADKFHDDSFKEGMIAHACERLGDPPSEAAEGNPKNWVFGGPGNEPDMMIIVASDNLQQLRNEVDRLEESIYSGRSSAGECANSGVQIIYKQHGATLPPPLIGHEHFGFLDGVSQPGLRGRISQDSTDVLTLRQNPNDPNQGKPGQYLLWPGEFIFGYPRQNPAPGPDGKLNTDPGPSAMDCPVWAKDGSFVVARRLRQDVPTFRNFLQSWSEKIDIPPEHLAAKLVGRWQSGAPLMRQTQKDNLELGYNECANNHFKYQSASERINALSDEKNSCLESEHEPPLSSGDPDGLVCPFAAHIRKTNPRDDKGTSYEQLNETTIQGHRMLRRGIPFGEPYYSSASEKEEGNRGLMFIAYMTSIANQFEFVTWFWANNAQFKDRLEGMEVQAGHDFIIGQNNSSDGDRTRTFVLRLKDSSGEIKRAEMTTEDEWVVATGGGYFFAPSIEALRFLTGAQ